MLREMLARARQGHRTMAYPRGEPVLPDRFRGRPAVRAGACAQGCEACESACPTGAVSQQDNVLTLDMGKCLFCGECATSCPTSALRFTGEHRLSKWRRDELVVGGRTLTARGAPDAARRWPFRRSLKLRQVSAGGCNACEADINVLGTVGFDLGRFGIQIVASPRHADGLLVTGPVTENMKLALEKTFQAVPPPRLVVAVGACAISGGPYRGLAATHNGVGDMLPVDLWIPGCPPHPLTILDGLLRLKGA
jgi:Ni,Fe-hydrogenase III small subunit/formate hydrogenlyase subunit 6/NADH:ubiquinone oxidoreductase subunit I